MSLLRHRAVWFADAAVQFVFSPSFEDHSSPTSPSSLPPLVCRYSEGEIRFNLMAIVSDRKMIYERKIAELQTQLTEVSGSKRRPFSPGTALHAPKTPPHLPFFLPSAWQASHVKTTTIVSLILKCQEQLYFRGLSLIGLVTFDRQLVAMAAASLWHDVASRKAPGPTLFVLFPFQIFSQNKSDISVKFQPGCCPVRSARIRSCREICSH